MISSIKASLRLGRRKSALMVTERNSGAGHFCGRCVPIRNRVLNRFHTSSSSHMAGVSIESFAIQYTRHSGHRDIAWYMTLAILMVFLWSIMSWCSSICKMCVGNKSLPEATSFNHRRIASAWLSTRTSTGRFAQASISDSAWIGSLTRLK